MRAERHGEQDLRIPLGLVAQQNERPPDTRKAAGAIPAEVIQGSVVKQNHTCLLSSELTGANPSGPIFPCTLCWYGKQGS